MPARSDIDAADIPDLLPYIMIVEKAGDQFRYRLVGTAINRIVGYEATGVTVGSYLAAPEAAAEARAIFQRVYMDACPVFATGEFTFKSGLHLRLSLLTLPLSEDGSAVNMSISTLVARFPAGLTEKRGWLERQPAKVDDVLEVRDAAELERFCREWEQRCEPVDEERLADH
jgi:hypothetical protein